jgi:cell division protein ZapA
MSSVITVEIAGHRYPIRSTLDERYVTELAAYVDQKMRAASDSAPASDMLGLAVLVALNIADEFFRERERDCPPTKRRPSGARHPSRAHRGRSARASGGETKRLSPVDRPWVAR